MENNEPHTGGAAFRSLAVGFFDGVHLGHQAILRGVDRALTFRRHPLSVLAPVRAPRLLMDFDTRIAAIRACGVREVVALDFTPDFARLSPDEFVAAAGITPQTEVRCCESWRFGRGGAGDAAWLRARGYAVTVVPCVVHKGARVSSTRIRAALELGAVEDADAMLGRPFAVRGVPFAGKGEGTRLGFPTLNLALDTMEILLPFGVYAVEALGARAVANYGLAPTFGERAWERSVLEVHFLGDPPDALGALTAPAASPAPAPVSVRLLRFLRPERRFESPAALAEQIARDCAEAAR